MGTQAITSVLFALLLASCNVFEEAGCDLTEVTARSEFYQEHYRSVSIANSSYDATPRHLAIIADRIPGFGGFYFEGIEPNRVMYIYLQEPDQATAEEARKRIGGAFQGRFVFFVDVEPVQGHYDYRDLYTWYPAVRDIAFDTDYIYSVRLGAGKNRIEVQAWNQAALDKLFDTLRDTKVPSGAIAAEIIDFRPDLGCN